MFIISVSEEDFTDPVLPTDLGDDEELLSEQLPSSGGLDGILRLVLSNIVVYACRQPCA